MRFFRAVGKVFKPFVNFPYWMGWKQIASDGKVIGDMAKDVLNRPKTSERRDENFEAACKRLNLTEQELSKRQKQFFYRAVLYIAIATALFVYGFYLIVSNGFFMALLMCLSLVLICVSLAFREHFWYTQIKQRRLGMTVQDWFKCTFRGK